MQDECNDPPPMREGARKRRAAWWMSNVVMVAVIFAVVVRPGGLGGVMVGVGCVCGTAFSAVLWSYSER